MITFELRSFNLRPPLLNHFTGHRSPALRTALQRQQLKDKYACACACAGNNDWWLQKKRWLQNKRKSVRMCEGFQNKKRSARGVFITGNDMGLQESYSCVVK